MFGRLRFLFRPLLICTIVVSDVDDDYGDANDDDDDYFDNDDDDDDDYDDVDDDDYLRFPPLLICTIIIRIMLMLTLRNINIENYKNF